jgi:hypothetical protein
METELAAAITTNIHERYRLLDISRTVRLVQTTSLIHETTVIRPSGNRTTTTTSLRYTAGGRIPLENCVREFTAYMVCMLEEKAREISQGQLFVSPCEISFGEDGWVNCHTYIAAIPLPFLSSGGEGGEVTWSRL